ncbi:hypothetical protein DAEQUDRAFT_352225 [Daedalea quercina L-15889]|uniref:Uncharacterized protein n=1 Tax=Daedalea quercina L-15889 TaxID=1314783 RepID=A0A165TPA4_9APHY|nr:hypothetical protein DAEQUDRAFT_352225 [Daedalea quercina L-15889]
MKAWVRFRSSSRMDTGLMGWKRGCCVRLAQTRQPWRRVSLSTPLLLWWAPRMIWCTSVNGIVASRMSSLPCRCNFWSATVTVILKRLLQKKRHGAGTHYQRSCAMSALVVGHINWTRAGTTAQAPYEGLGLHFVTATARCLSAPPRLE